MPLSNPGWHTMRKGLKNALEFSAANDIDTYYLYTSTLKRTVALGDQYCSCSLGKSFDFTSWI